MDLKEENLMDEIGKKKKKKTIITTFVVILILILCGILAYYFLFLKKDNGKNKNQNVNNIILESEYEMSGNELEDFDLAFLKLENNEKNMIYSPLSIKYALEMLAEGANGKTKAQITSVLGEYQAKKYENSKNMSFANALFIKSSYKNSIKESYIDTLKSKYNAEVIYDTFKTPNNLNSWVENKTLNLINNLFDDVSELDYALVNALAIDMEWVNKIQSQYDFYYSIFNHETIENNTNPSRYEYVVSPLSETGYNQIKFENLNYNIKAVNYAAIANRYNVIDIYGEDEIRKIVTKEFENYKKNNPGTIYDINGEIIEDFDIWLDNYVNELEANYGMASSSTDFEFYIDDNVKLFAKDLKEYDGRTLQYIGIMPTKENLKNYIKETQKEELNDLIKKLNPIEIESFSEGYITELYGDIPLFNYEYEINLINDLKEIGITDIFDEEKADLSNLTNDKTKIIDTKHKANIEFSNDGIKAAAATYVGGGGAVGSDYFDYFFEIPIKRIDLTFNKPYLYLIRDKDSKEVWFIGTVYEPTMYEEYNIDSDII